MESQSESMDIGDGKRPNSARTMLRYSSKFPRMKVLLLGTGFSGKSTAFFQAHQLYKKGTPNQGYVAVIIGRVRFSCVDVAIKLIHSSPTVLPPKYVKFILDYDNPKVGTQISPTTFFSTSPSDQKQIQDEVNKVFSAIILLYKEVDLKEAKEEFKKSRYYFDGAQHFMDIDLLKKVMQSDYSPLDKDILATRIKTTGLTKLQVVLDSIEYEIIDIGGQKNERRKWAAQMNGVDMLVYIISLSDYDEVLYEEEDDTSRMIEALQLFPKTIEGEWFAEKPVLVLWNKKEKLVEKLVHGVTPQCIFKEYRGGNDIDKCIEFIKGKFLEKIPKMSQSRMTHVIGSAIHEDTIKEVFKAVIKIAQELKREQIEALSTTIDYNIK
jgi:hypothetical protein